jgi:hypothetical protein
VIKKIDVERIVGRSVSAKVDTDCPKIGTEPFDDGFPHPRGEPGPVNENRGVSLAAVIMDGYFDAVF